MKLTLNIPESLSEVTLDQYQQWLKVAEDKELDNFLTAEDDRNILRCNTETSNAD